jgi:regulator of sigma E protease
MEILIRIVAFLIAVFILILIHEYGHFLAARIFKVEVIRFSIGFGRPILKFKSKKYDTEFTLGIFPLGGYVKMLEADDAHRKNVSNGIYDYQNVWKKLLIVLAGPIANIVFAFLLFVAMFTVGIKVPQPIIGSVTHNSIAAMAGLRADNEITWIDKNPVMGWQDVVLYLFPKIGDSQTITIKTRKGAELEETAHFVDLANLTLDPYQPDPLEAIGIMPYVPSIPPIIGNIAKNSPAEKANLQKGDVILKINGIGVDEWRDFIEVVKNSPNKKIELLVRRENENIAVPVTTDWQFNLQLKKIGYLGIQSLPVIWPPEKLSEKKYPLLISLVEGAKQVYKFTSFSGIILTKLVTGKMSLHILGGPISIFQGASEAFLQGMMVYVNFLAILGLMLAFINLLPIPGLDGGYLIFLLSELVTRRRVSHSVQNLVLKIGFAFLLVVIFQATLNDLMRMFH